MAEPETIGRIRTLAHDLANLLTVLEGSLELFERQSAGNPAMGKLVRNMRLATERADTIAKQLREIGGVR